jgi:hypothetical protein
MTAALTSPKYPGWVIARSEVLPATWWMVKGGLSNKVRVELIRGHYYGTVIYADGREERFWDVKEAVETAEF